jgi:hypothetical protein
LASGRPPRAARGSLAGAVCAGRPGPGEPADLAGGRGGRSAATRAASSRRALICPAPAVTVGSCGVCACTVRMGAICADACQACICTRSFALTGVALWGDRPPGPVPGLDGPAGVRQRRSRVVHPSAAHAGFAYQGGCGDSRVRGGRSAAHRGVGGPSPAPSLHNAAGRVRRGWRGVSGGCGVARSGPACGAGRGWGVAGAR